MHPALSSEKFYTPSLPLSAYSFLPIVLLSKIPQLVVVLKELITKTTLPEKQCRFLFAFVLSIKLRYNMYLCLILR